MSHQARLMVIAVLEWAAFSTACEPARGTTQVTSADLTSSEQNAAYRIATARCERQGPTCAHPASRDACVSAMLLPSAADADLADCASPIDEDALARCVSEIRAGRCGTGIAGVDACQQRKLCPQVAEEGTL